MPLPLETKLNPGDVVTADNVILTFDGEKYLLSTTGLQYANIFIIGSNDNEEHEIKHRSVAGRIVPYFNI